ncbi:MAG TPA: trigger factor [Acidobacteriaceae bacterium]|nr:trigger factor [Acidobacteriaceae bacterium]
MSPTESTTTPQTGEDTQQPTETGAPASTLATNEEANSLAETSADAAHDHDHTHDHGPTLNPECTRQVDVEVPADEVSRAFATVVKQYRRAARIPGFRAGKVPESVIRRKFADQIQQDVLEQILPPHFRAEIEKQGVQPVSQPQVTSMHLVDGEPMRFQAAFEVLPAIDIAGYDQVKVDRPNTTLDDAEFESELAHVRDSHAIMEPVEEDRPLADGDFAQIRFTGLVHGGDGSAEGDAAKPIEGDDATVEIGGPNTVEAFTEALRGAKVGQQMQFEVSYPEDFTEKRLAGKSVAYDVEVKGIRKKILPELDDAFAKQMGEYETIDQFKQKLREHMANDKRRRLESEAKDKLVGSFVERYQFPVPESLLQQQIDARLDRGLRALAAQGMTTEQMRNLDFTRLRTAQRESAMNELRGSLILDRIATVENIEVAEEEMESQLQLLAYQAREPIEVLRKRLTEDGGLTRIREQLRREKTVNQLFERLAA